MKYIDDKASFYDYLANHCNCVNAKQSKQERRLKYAVCKALGCNRNQATRYKDWRYTTIARRFGYSSWENLIKIISEGVSNG